MRKALFAAVWILIAAVTPGIAQSGGRQSAKESVRDKLVGSWRLLWVEEQLADGTMKRYTDRVGTIVYTRDGHMSVQIMLPETQDASGNNPVKYDQGHYEAYYGPYDVDEAAHTVTHHVEGALVRSLIGKNLTRFFRFEGRQLILKSSRPDEHWTIAWEQNQER
jgi:Lipocalin-like domain